MSEKSYHLFKNGCLTREDNSLCLIDEGDEKHYIPIENVEDIYAHGQIDFNTRLFSFLNSNGICIHIFGWNGQYSGSFVSERSTLSGSTVVNQVEAYNNYSSRMDISREMVLSSIFNMKDRLQYHSNRHSLSVDYIGSIESRIEDAKQVSTINDLMSVEAEAKKLYYNIFEEVVPEDFEFNSRDYNPPSNELNALISFGNSLLYTSVLSKIRQTALDPSVSFLHEPSDRRYSLSLDIADIFKPIIVDRLIIRLINRGVIDIDSFRDNLKKCVLNEESRKKFVSKFEKELEKTIKHKDLNRHVSYDYLLLLEVYKIKKRVLANEDYNGFRKWW